VLASSTVMALRLLSLLVLVTALLTVQGTFGGGLAPIDRTELPSGSGDEGGGNGFDDGIDLTVPAHPLALLAQPSPAGRSLFETHRAPATPPVASRIFRPPISVLA
jgi:hypothetical protein